MDTYKEIHACTTVVDAHCDTLTVLKSQKRQLGNLSKEGHIDLPRLILGGVNVQFFASFVSYVSPGIRTDNPLARALEIFDVFYQEMALATDRVEPAFSYNDIERIVAGQKIAALLAVEGGEALAGRIEVLRMFYRLGVRCITLTWNDRNELADGASEYGTGGGLSSFGTAVVKEMNRLGMLIDVSHLSPQGFWDVLKNSEKPVIASHSNTRSICEHQRNLSDDQIKSLAAQGGVMGLCFYPDFVGKKEPSLDMLLDHAVHVADMAGVDCLGLGSDFDGIECTLPELSDVTCLPVVTEGLFKRGFSQTDVQKILGGNFLRVLSQVL